jgi:outer membrane lipase/esterase
VQNAAAAGATQQQIAGAAVQAAALLGAPVADATAAATKAGVDAQAAGAKAGADYAAAEGPKLVAALGAAGAELANIVNTQILAKGAKYIVVNNLPDVASTPSGKAQAASTQQLIAAMVDAFNAQLKANLKADPAIAYVDLFSVSKDQVANPAIYGLTNTAQKACTSPSSLTCTAKTLSAPDTSHFMFADDIHPTPYEYWLVTRYVLKDMAVKGWL